MNLAMAALMSCSTHRSSVRRPRADIRDELTRRRPHPARPRPPLPAVALGVPSGPARVRAQDPLALSGAAPLAACDLQPPSASDNAGRTDLAEALDTWRKVICRVYECRFVNILYFIS